MGNRREFKGAFASELKMLLDEKRACGIKYVEGERIMHKFDEFCILRSCSNGLTKELVLEFTEPRPNWSQSTYSQHIAVMSQIARFFNLHGLPAYIPDTKQELGINRSFSPYIFSVDEIKRIFYEADRLYSGRSYIRSADFYPVIFRLLYSCGMRVSEALLLTMKDVDLVNGTVFIKNGKNHKDRLLPLNPQMIPYLEQYAEKYHKSFRDDDYFFAPPHGGHYDKGTVYHRFRDILFKCGISHGGRGNGGPRLHCLRHTFCVHSMRQFLSNGVDHRAALPILSVYMGHSSIAATGKYLRLTAEVYPEISELMEKEFGGLIPVWEAKDIETD
jgi:integrase